MFTHMVKIVQTLRTKIKINNSLTQLEQLEQYTKLGSQIRSRLPPMISIDNPSPLAPITENLMQTKSLLPSNPNSSFSHLQNKILQITSPPFYLSLIIYGIQQPLILTLLLISTQFLLQTQISSLKTPQPLH